VFKFNQYHSDCSINFLSLRFISPLTVRKEMLLYNSCVILDKNVAQPINLYATIDKKCTTIAISSNITDNMYVEVDKSCTGFNNICVGSFNSSNIIDKNVAYTANSYTTINKKHLYADCPVKIWHVSPLQYHKNIFVSDHACLACIGFSYSGR